MTAGQEEAHDRRPDVPAPATGLYHVYDGDDGLIYIGVSKHFGIRWQQPKDPRYSWLPP